MIATSASLRSDFIHIVGMAIHIAPECTNHITGIRTLTSVIFAGRSVVPTGKPDLAHGGVWETAIDTGGRQPRTLRCKALSVLIVHFTQAKSG